MKKETLIIIFYILYFGWLFTVTYLTQDPKLLNYFTLGIAIFYIVFLREKGDIIWFLAAALLPILIGAISFKNWDIRFDSSVFRYFPPWLALAWGTTAVALRKFYLIINS